MRALHLVHSFSKLSETFIYDYVTSLQKQNISVHIITFNHLNLNDRPFESVKVLALPWWNIPRIYQFSRNKLLGRSTETSSWSVYRKRLKQIILEVKPDVLHAHFGPMGVLIAPVADKLKIPLVVTFYGYDISELTHQKNWRQAYLELAKTADFVTVLSEEMKERALKSGFKSKQVKVIHLGTRVDRIAYQKPAYPIQHFLSIGRLSEKKGHLDTLEAFKLVLQKSNRQLDLTIIGEGEDRRKIESYIQTHHLQDSVSLPGSVPHAKVIDYLYEADAFILNSKTSHDGDKEGTPTVLAEAQAAGLPCISTFHSGIPEMIPAENHRFLADEGDIHMIASNIERLLSASEEEINDISQAGRLHVEAEFDVLEEAGKFKDLYEKLILKI